MINAGGSFDIDFDLLEYVPDHLADIQSKGRAFDFVALTRGKPILLVGEGDLSFALALARDPKSCTKNIVATTFERLEQLSEAALKNARELTRIGATVLHGADACRLDGTLPCETFEAIVFQFPNTGTRRSVHGRTDNHVLVRRFLPAARGRLRQFGRVLITIVNSPHHNGAFDLPAAADWAGFELEGVYPFYRSAWKGYGHVNTNDDDESALVKYRSCRTWAFRAVRPDQ